MYRFINSKKVTEEILVKELCNRSAQLCAKKHVLCIQDTTEMNYYSHRHRIKEDSGLGRLVGNKPSYGFKMHSTLMVDAFSSELLGFSDIQLWHRPLDMPNRKERKYQSLPIEEKESYKWIRASEQSSKLLKEASSITFIEDREGDIFEQMSSNLFVENTHYIIRSKSNRITTESDKAWDKLSKQPIVGNFEIDLPTDYRKNRKKGTVRLNIRYAEITLERNSHIKKNSSKRDTITLNIVEAYEDKVGGLSWKLLTTHPINEFKDAFQIVHWYSQRWYIEQMHRLLKQKGFQIEESQLETGWGIRKLCVLMMSALLRIMQMNIAYNEPEGEQLTANVYSEKELECLELINKKIEGKTKKLKNNNEKRKLKWASWIIARLGGWKGYDSQGKPGLIVLKRGLDKFYDIYYGWELAKDVGTQ